jgi:hypothetical protein
VPAGKVGRMLSTDEAERLLTKLEARRFCVERPCKPKNDAAHDLAARKDDAAQQRVGSRNGRYGIFRAVTSGAPLGCTRFGISSEVFTPTPVRLPPGRLRLDTRPSATGSGPPMKRTGIRCA